MGDRHGNPGQPNDEVAAVDSQLEPLGYEQITDVSSATGLTVPAGSTHALIQPVTQNVRWRDDGTNPTASVGMQIAAGNDMWYSGDLDAIKFFEETASAELNVSYYRSAGDAGP